jgi:hypothetical protein
MPTKVFKSRANYIEQCISAVIFSQILCSEKNYSKILKLSASFTFFLYIKFLQYVVVMLYFYIKTNVFELRDWKLENFRITYLGTIIFELRTSKKLRQI